MADTAAEDGRKVEAREQQVGLQRPLTAEEEDEARYPATATTRQEASKKPAHGTTQSKAPDETVPMANLTGTITRTTEGGGPYSAFSKKEKWFIVILSSIAGIFSPIGSNIYVPAIPALARAFHVSNEKINLTVTLYLVFQAVTPALWGAASDSYGRRPIYLIILLIFVLSCIGTALCPTDAYWLLMLMRAVQSSGGSAMIALGAGIIGDLAVPQERGKFLGVFNLGTNFAPAISPVLGGVFAYTLGWRSIFWFLLIFSAITYIFVALFLPETLRSLVGNGSIPPPPWSRTLMSVIKERREKKEGTQPDEEALSQRPHREKFKPWASFLLAFEPDLSLMFLWASLYYALWYALLTIYSTLLKDKYGASEIVIGLCYIPHGLAAGVASVVTGKIMDVFYRREKARVGGDHRERPEEFRLERARFIVLPPCLGLLVASVVSVGWSMQAKAPIAVPIILNGLVGCSLGFFTTVTVYGLDLFPGQGGATTATFNLIRCALGAVSVSVVQIINTKVGAGWTFIILAAVSLAGTPLPLIVLKWGPRWRLRRLHKAKLKREADRVIELRRIQAGREAERSEENTESSRSR